jgi:hypothetical protein
MNNSVTVLDISNAIISTNGNVIDEIIIYEWISDDNFRFQIILEVWELKSGHYPVSQNLDGTATQLPNSICHTFQWRLEELFHDCETEDDWELIDMEEAPNPLYLVHNFPDGPILDEARDTVTSWLDNEYVAMTSEVQ